MFTLFSRWRQERVIRRSTVTDQQWQQVLDRLPVLNRLTDDDKARLIRLSILFLHEKSLEGAHDLSLTGEMQRIIALQACLLILNLGLDWYDGWYSVIVYPAQFIPERKYIDEYGIEHRSNAVLSGESWHHGPVVLSWEDTEFAGEIDGHNLVIHEFAHKLDVLNGAANGFPPLHRGMNVTQWESAFSEAYNDIQNRLLQRDGLPIDRYAASSPAEFFAVISEVFFEQPDVIIRYYPAVYHQLKQFYRQDPLASVGAQ